jgi:hypothetical protein
MPQNAESHAHDLLMALSMVAYLMTTFTIGLAIGVALEDKCRLLVKNVTETVASSPVPESYRGAK